MLNVCGICRCGEQHVCIDAQCSAWTSNPSRQHLGHFTNVDTVCGTHAACCVCMLQAPCTDRQCHHCGQHSSSASDTCSATSPASQVHLTLLQGVNAPSRVWLQSFFAELQPGRRQVCACKQLRLASARLRISMWCCEASGALSQCQRCLQCSSHAACLGPPQVGLDDVLHMWYYAQQVQQAHSKATSCSAAACRAAARTGVPTSARPWVWAAALGLPACPPAEAACSCSCQGGESSSSSSKDGTDEQLPTGSIKQDAWWRIPNQRDTAKLDLLCNAVKQQVCLWVSSIQVGLAHKSVHQEGTPGLCLFCLQVTAVIERLASLLVQGLLVDVLTCADVQQMADNAHFFVFEEAMR